MWRVLRRAVLAVLFITAPARADLTVQPGGTSPSPLVARPMLGPFPSLRAACAKLRGRCDLTPLASVPVDGPQPGAVVFVTTYYEKRSDVGAQLAHLAVSIQGTWFVAPEVASGWNDFLRHSSMAASLQWADLMPGGAPELRAEITVNDSSHDTPRAQERVLVFVGIGASGRPTATQPLHAQLRRTRGYPIGGVPYQSTTREIDARDGVLTIRAVGDALGAPVELDLLGRHALVFP